MKVVLDEGVPERLGEYLPGHEVHSVRTLGLKGVKNGKLLAAITEQACEAFISNDKRMEAEGQLARRPFAILILSATNWPVIQQNVGKVAVALQTAQVGEVVRVDVGKFVPRKFRPKPLQP